MLPTNGLQEIYLQRKAQKINAFLDEISSYHTL